LESESQGLVIDFALGINCKAAGATSKKDADHVQRNSHPSIYAIVGKGDVGRFLEVIDETLAEVWDPLVSPKRNKSINDHGKLRIDGAPEDRIHAETFPHWTRSAANDK
jgi:hypothetical protein